MHNMITCNSKKCTINSYPLTILPKKIDKQEFEFDAEKVKSMVKKVDLRALGKAALEMGLDKHNYEDLNQEDLQKEDLLRLLNRVLFEVVLVEGALKCEGCSTVYSVSNGIVDFCITEQ